MAFEVDHVGRDGVLERMDALVRTAVREGGFDWRVTVGEGLDALGRMRISHDADRGRFERWGSTPAQVLRVMAMLSGAVEDRRSMTPRDVYYIQKGAAFDAESHASCVELIRKVGWTLRLPRSCLHVYANCKGLVAGPLVVHTRTRTRATGPGPPAVVSESAWEAQVAIRSDVTERGAVTVHALPQQEPPRFGLLVEKEAIFHELVSSGVHQRLRCAIITGKGFPCLGTRAFVRRMHEAFPRMPIFGVADWNPSGLAIMLLFAHGSAREPEAYLYAVPSITIVGMLKRDIQNLGAALTRGMQTLSDADRARCATLKEMYATSAAVDIAAEVDFMLQTNSKLELEALNNMPNASSNYLATEWLPALLHD